MVQVEEEEDSSDTASPANESSVEDARLDTEPVSSECVVAVRVEPRFVNGMAPGSKLLLDDARATDCLGAAVEAARRSLLFLLGPKPRLQKGGDHLPQVFRLGHIVANALHDSPQKLVLCGVKGRAVGMGGSVSVGPRHKEAPKDGVKEQLGHQPAAAKEDHRPRSQCFFKKGCICQSAVHGVAPRDGSQRGGLCPVRARTQRLNCHD